MSLRFIEAKFRRPEFTGSFRTSALNSGTPYRRRKFDKLLRDILKTVQDRM